MSDRVSAVAAVEEGNSAARISAEAEYILVERSVSVAAVGEDNLA